MTRPASISEAMPAVVPFGPYRGQNLGRVRDNLVEAARRTVWPHDPRPPAPSPSVAVITVNYNTASLTAHLLYSLLRVLPPASISRIVVVDNNSVDGSVPLLEGLGAEGLIDVVHNHRLPYHGPGLNRAMSYLAGLERAGAAHTDLVWALDSDVVVLRADVVAHVVAALRAAGATLAGELGPEEPDLLPMGCMYLSAMLIDPCAVWRRRIRPFWEHGSPSVGMQRSLRDRAARLAEFPFFRDQYLLHLGQGTVDELVRRNDTANRYYRWAARPRGYTHHWAGNPDGPELYGRFLERFSQDVPVITAAALAAACRQEERVSLVPGAPPRPAGP